MKTYRDIVKEIGRTDKDGAHTYGQWYELWFQQFRDRPVNILELGVCIFGGGCALSFAEYFQQGTIWAVDIDTKPCSIEVFNHPRIKLIQGDAYHPDILKNFEGIQFDIIIDDASHEINDQFALVAMLKPFLADDGFYVIEDCCTCHWLEYLPKIRDLNLRHTLIDMSTATCYDNTLIRLESK